MPKLKAVTQKQVKQAPVPRVMLGVLEAEESTGLSKSTLYLLMAEGLLGYVKYKKRRLIPISEIEALPSRLAGRWGGSVTAELDPKGGR
jgi:hypothetical protein